MARKPFTGAKRPTKHDERLRKFFADKPSALKYILAKMVSLHKEAVTEGLAVFQHNADPMISISSKASKFSGFTPRQADYVTDVITDKVHAPIAWAALKEIDPVAYAAAAEGAIDATPVVETIAVTIEDEESDEIVVEDGEPVKPIAERPANWGMF